MTTKDKTGDRLVASIRRTKAVTEKPVHRPWKAPPCQRKNAWRSKRALRRVTTSRAAVFGRIDSNDFRTAMRVECRALQDDHLQYHLLTEAV